MKSLHETSKVGAKSATADSCFGLIGPHQCSAALGGPATGTSTEDQIDPSRLSYNTIEHEGELYRMNLSCSGEELPEILNGCSSLES